jgi:hypothetical protein
MFSKIRCKVGRLAIRKSLKNLQRTKKVYNLTTARRIGILFNATDDHHFDQVMEFYKFLKLKGIVTHVIGFVDAKDVPDKYLFKKDFHFFLKKHLSWYYRPLSDEAEKFLQGNFDILIDLNLDDNFPCQFLVALSPAHFKVGRYTDSEGFYDLMIDIGKGKKIDYFIDQTKHYLELINRPDLAASVLE